MQSAQDPRTPKRSSVKPGRDSRLISPAIYEYDDDRCIQFTPLSRALKTKTHHRYDAPSEHPQNEQKHHHNPTENKAQKPIVTPTPSQHPHVTYNDDPLKGPLHTNGNVSEYIDSSDGTIAAHYEYDPFGNTTVSTGPLADDFVYRFSTKYLDESTDLYYYGFRYYSPNLGRWINRDPIGELGGKNLYEFVKNNTSNMIDLLGLSTSCPIEPDELRDMLFNLGDCKQECIDAVDSEYVHQKGIYERFNRRCKEAFLLADIMSLPKCIANRAIKKLDLPGIPGIPGAGDLLCNWLLREDLKKLNSWRDSLKSQCDNMDDCCPIE